MGLFSKKKKQEVFNQETQEQGEFQPLFQMHLLFDHLPLKPEVKQIHEALNNRFGEVAIVSGDSALSSFAIKAYEVVFNKGSMPAQVLMADAVPFSQDKISDFDRAQFWNVDDSDELLAGCSYSLLLSDFMSSQLDYKDRCHMLMEWLETGLALFPECKAVWVPSAGKLMTADQIRNNPAEGNDRFIYAAVNVRFFNIQGTDDMMVDTLGLYAVGLPDLQYHFHSLEPNQVVNHAYNVASYVFEANAPVSSGETIDGLDEQGNMSREVQWPCQYERALIQPVREVMDICPGEFAAGQR